MSDLPSPQDTSIPPGEPSPKRIVLFSDGTGNSSAKLFKTNVWRMYEAVDLGPAAPKKRTQIAYYDDGVGTSPFKPLAVLGGVFGHGLRRNVLDLYKYACRNYRAGDQLYAFGFSRGAFTIRLVVALIASQGLVYSESEADLDRLARQAYREFRRDWLPRRVKRPTEACRWIRDAFTRWRDRKRIPYAEVKRFEPPIDFVGVWDTVSAYGGPLAELTRAIDNWIFPLSMPDYKLHPKVRRARHALALDDERDAFHPLLWDEVHEAALVAAGEASEERLRQVWFTGMHSDVGGGYPDESLSYVSLLWMMEEAEKADLRTLDVIKDRFVALASSAGPIHDSRGGVAGYYRYQPRRIAAWVDPIDPRTRGLRDPLIAGEAGPRGLLRTVRVHGSVVARIVRGTDRYAPITLPDAFEIVPPETVDETAPQADSSAADPAREARPGTPPPPRKPLVEQALRARLGDKAVQTARGTAFEPVWDLVWRRRVAYFVTVAFTVVLAALPMWVSRAPDPPFLADGRTWLDAPLRAAGLLLPAFLGYWLRTFAENPFYFLALTICIVATMRYGAACERRLRDEARGIWQRATTPNGQQRVTPPTKIQALRNSPAYQRAMQRFKWTVLPDVVFMPLIAATAFWLFLAGVTQITLPWLEDGSTFCAKQDNLTELTEATGLTFETSARCLPVGRYVVRERRYRVELTVKEPWFDGSHSTSPLGLRARDMGVAGLAGGPFRRVIDANYLQPVVEIRRQRSWWNDGVHMTPLLFTEHQAGVFSAEFTAARDGELFVFANDAVLPGWPSYFYTSKLGLNKGTADLRIVRLAEANALAGKAVRESQSASN